MYTIEMAYAQMRYLQEQASRSRVSTYTTTNRAGRRESLAWADAGTTGGRGRRAAFRGRKH